MRKLQSWMRWATLISICVLAAWGCAAGRRNQTTTMPAAELPLCAIDNFAEVAPGIYRGAQPMREDFQTLQKLGIKTVINLRESDTDSFKLRGLGMRYVNIPASAWVMGDAEVVAVLKILEDPANYPVFIHCHYGADRTGCVVAAYRMLHEGWPAERAIQEMYSYGHSAIYLQMRNYLRRLDVEALRQRVGSATAAKLQVID
jgi:protein tyrosine/serine phosphatase